MVFVCRDTPLDNVPQVLLQPWAAALFHDKFQPFYDQLLQELTSQDERDKRSITRIVRQHFLNFIKEHRRDFPMYTDH